ncbi:MAG: thioredoxin family protein, partial [Bacteroidota bacterium]|nr:thioredoxin family protein [Bacteroidota bacterium]
MINRNAARINLEPSQAISYSDTATQPTYSKISPISGINCFTDYDEALANARANKKPLLIYFNGYAVVNCRK